MDARVPERKWVWGWGVLLVSVALFFMGSVVIGTKEWLAFHHKRLGLQSEWKYPTLSVAASCGFILAEALVLWLLLTRLRTSLWLRALVATLASASAAALIFVNMSLHSPPYVVNHCLWLMCVTVPIGAVFMVSAGGAIVDRGAARSGSRPTGR